MPYHQAGSMLRNSLITLSIIAIVLAFAFTLLPKGFSGDVSKIGQGSPSIVLTHNKNSVQSLELMELMGQVRADYEHKLEFLVINVETPTGKAFINRQDVYSSSLVLFGPLGKQLTTLDSTTNEVSLRLILDQL